MKASEIISDDIVSREKYKTKDVVGKKTASQDYFGNRADKRDDRALVSKDKKERKKEWFEEDEIDEGWKQNVAGAALAGAAALGGGGAHAAPQVPQAPQATSVASSNAAIVKSLVNPQAQKRFAAQQASDPKALHDQWVQNVRNAAEFDNPYQIVSIALNKAKLTPQEVLQNLPKGYQLPATEPTGSYVPKGTPRVKEGSMAAATHKKSGPKFGGYWKGTDKAPPKKGQGFGGAAESVGVELDEVAPPGMEDMVRKLKKEYPGHPEKAFATAWSIYNKKKGKK